jgi:hypothetical protein
MKLTSWTLLCATSMFAACGTVAPVPVVADDIDHAKVNAINSVARAHGVQVYWINLPQKVRTSSASKPGGAG